MRATAASAMGVVEINRLKALTRIGMGRCQGRMCGSGGGGSAGSILWAFAGSGGPVARAGARQARPARVIAEEEDVA